MEDKILKQIEEKAIELFPFAGLYDELFSERYNWSNGAKYGYNIKESVINKQSVNAKLDFYSMDLNTERIKTYTALCERYLVTITTIRDIFDAGLNFAASKYESKLSASQNTVSNEGGKWVSMKDKLYQEFQFVGSEKISGHTAWKLIEDIINPPKEK